MTVTLHHGDCREVLAMLAADSVEACVTDPPYHLTSKVSHLRGGRYAGRRSDSEKAARASRGFMGKSWDGGDIAQDPEMWAAVLRVLKPGAHLAAFGGTRTFHRMMCAIEDAGFEIRDTCMWVYGSGFPKSHNQPGGLGTALKPAWEPIVLARKPLAGTVAANIAKHGTGALNIASCRVPTSQDAVDSSRADSMVCTCSLPTVAPMSRIGRNGSLASSAEQHAPRDLLHPNGCAHGSDDQELPGSLADYRTCSHCGGELPHEAEGLGRASPQQQADARIARDLHAEGGHSRADLSKAYSHHTTRDIETQSRWPANVCHDGSPEVLAAFAAFGERPSGSRAPGEHQPLGFYGNAIVERPAGMERAMPGLAGDTGTAARFFFCGKATREEREIGCGGLELGVKRILNGGIPSAVNSDPRGMSGGGDRAARNTHPTVKPLSLMSWLCRLITPKGGTILDPFAGSGSTLVAAAREGFSAIGIEREAEYVEIARRRVHGDAPLFADLR